MSGAARWLPLLAVAALAAAFASLNRGERVVVDVGVATFYRVPLTGVVFVAFVAGMGAMMLLSLRQDLALRRELRARGTFDGAPPAETPSPPVRTEEDDRTVVLPADPSASERRAHAEDAEDAERI